MSNIRVKVDVTKINKEKLFKGTKGTYLDLTLIPTKGDKFGNDYMVVQDLGKGPDGKYVKGGIIGNGKLAGYGGGGSGGQQQRSNPTQASADPEDVPF